MNIMTFHRSPGAAKRCACQVFYDARFSHRFGFDALNTCWIVGTDDFGNDYFYHHPFRWRLYE